MSPKQKPTKEEILGAFQIVLAIGDTIRDLGSVPSGHLYAQLMGRLSINEYEKILGILESAGQIRRESSHLLVWTGPAKPTA